MELKKIDNRFIIHTSIGSGGYASVFLASDLISRELVAIKILNAKISINDKNYKMFCQEAMTLAAISNPHVVKIYSSGIYDDKPYLVMEYVKGSSIKDLIKEHGYLLIEEVYNYMLQIIDGLECCHNANIIHRDIKSQNIIKKSDGTVVLLDFGIASITDDDKNLYKNEDSIIGTPQYLAPEIAKTFKATIQSDIYALGILMYEMFSGKYPYNIKKDDNKIEIVKMHISCPFPSIRKICPNVPIDFEQIINKCCQKSPDKRYQSVNEIRNDLQKAFDNYKNPSKKKKFFLFKLFKGKNK